MKISFKRYTRGKFAFLGLFFVILILFFACSLAVLARFKPIFEEKALYAAKVKAISILNDAINSVFDDKASRQYVDITADKDGKIESVSANTSEMNKLKSEIALCIQRCAENAENAVIYIPVGSLTKYPVLQGIGYRIPVKISFDGVSKVDFDDEFTQSGINQVKHKIFLTATAKFSVISAVMTASERVSTEIPVAETVIVGDVPIYYGDNLSVVGR